jgi:L-rhamnose isomerase
MSMSTAKRYEEAKAIYKKIGVNTDAALKELKNIAISMHCWQGDDVSGFENAGSLTGGIQATGNYMGKARTPDELMADIDKAMSLIPGIHRVNLHANYAIFEKGKKVDRDKLEPKHFKRWVEFAKKRKLGLDFNPTMFSHPKADGLTLSHEDPAIRAFWVRHTQACIKIAEYFARELKTHSALNIWIPDGFKDVPSDRMAPRARLKASLDEVFKMKYNKKSVIVTVESKLFGIGAESCTVGSHEFYMNYAAKNNVLCLLDNGHFHPTESVADKISSMLLFADKVALHVSRPVRWDSDHVVRFDDETRAIAEEIIKNGSDRVILALDYFDASINRVAAWVLGMRNMQKALLAALLLPRATLAKLQNKRHFTEMLMLQEEMKTYPLSDVWAMFCAKAKVPGNEAWFDQIKAYETEVLSKRV